MIWIEEDGELWAHSKYIPETEGSDLFLVPSDEDNGPTTGSTVQVTYEEFREILKAVYMVVKEQHDGQS